MLYKYIDLHILDGFGMSNIMEEGYEYVIEMIKLGINLILKP